MAQRFSAVLGNYQLFKYRCKNTHAGVGASYGFRCYALFDSASITVYPILPFPKPEMDDAPDAEIIKCVREMVDALKQQDLPGNGP